ncbi:MAG: hypothetical protein Q8Q10_04485 [bacterium]|nr:hypothetical protein [bacterium]
MLLIANENPFVSKVFALFDAVVGAGEEAAHITLPVSLRVFLTDCLIEHLRDHDILGRTLALDFLEAGFQAGSVRRIVLKRTGDASLILAWFFPEMAKQRNVKPSYFRAMGQASYSSLAAHLCSGPMYERGKLYNQVAHGFVPLERVLDKARVRADTWSAFQRFRAHLDDL